MLITIPNSLEKSRIAVSAGRVVGNAVKRNRAKRLVRAVLCPLTPSLRTGWDVVILARRPMAKASFWDTSRAVQELLFKADLITNE